MEHLFTVNCIEKTKIKKKRPEWPLKMTNDWVQKADVIYAKKKPLCHSYCPKLGAHW